MFMSEENKAIVRRYIEEALGNGKLSVIEDIFAVDVMSHTPNGNMEGIEGISEPVTMRRNAFPDLTVTIDDQIAEGDKVVTRLTFSGTHRGDYRGMAATGRKATWNQIAIARIENGKIVESWRIPDRLGLRQQLSAG